MANATLRYQQPLLTKPINLNFRLGVFLNSKFFKFQVFFNSQFFYIPGYRSVTSSRSRVSVYLFTCLLLSIQATLKVSDIS
jgi:hypothetical protein